VVHVPTGGNEDAKVDRRLAAILAADIAGYSALMGADEARTVRDLKEHQAAVLPMIGEFGGHIIDTAGDGILAEFASVVNALECAVAVQRKMAERNAAFEAKRRMQFRIGVNIGDVIFDEARIYGDGINIAARLEAIAEPGGICISRQAYDQVESKLALGFRNLGPQHLKNIVKPVEVFAVDGTGGSDEAPGLDRASLALPQEIKYCRAPDGVRLAYAIAGSGPPLVKTANWMNHLEYDWESPIWRHVCLGLAREHTLIRYDARGNGMSDWDVDELSLDAWVSDLETVVDAAGVERFPLLGISQGCAVSVAYAVRHPERVSHLVLYGGFALGGKKRAPAEKEKRMAMMTLMRLGWGADSPVFRQMFTGLIIPGGTHEQANYFNELQRRTTSPECAARYFDVVNDIDVSELLAKVTVPTLVMHARGDLMVPFEAGRQLAAGIPGAHFIALPGQNHLFLQDEPASDRFFEEIKLFLGR
jgi:class 3 adenylate cyclase/pimeloyl-ACP methyl ester carboxylesterase